MSKARSNGTHEKADKTSDARPSRPVEVYSDATEPTASDDEFLANNNLGLGNYTRKEYYQQVDAYKKGEFADAAFGRRIIRLGKRQTQLALGRQAWADLDAEERARICDPDRGECAGRREWIRAEGRRRWDDGPGIGEYDLSRVDDIDGLRETLRWNAFAEETDISKNWQSPFRRMLLMRHEGSRSIGSRLLDNLFGRILERRKTIDAGEDGGGLFSRSRSDERTGVRK
jgi:hypothetical protein